MLRRAKSPAETSLESLAESERSRAADEAARAVTVGKGRPTPSRREAEAAAKARTKVPRTRKEQQAQQRSGRSESSAKLRAGMKAGDERYLLPRDQGPVRRFVRDWVDTRFSVMELALPLMFAAVVLGVAGAAALGNSIMLALLLVLIVEAFLLRRRMRKAVLARFPGTPMKGLTYYTLSRCTQLRFMRIPKARLRRGDPLPEHYR